eukprot:6198413-Pleurochrysis_carterae.AAC.2
MCERCVKSAYEMLKSCAGDAHLDGVFEVNDPRLATIQLQLKPGAGEGPNHVGRAVQRRDGPASTEECNSVASKYSAVHTSMAGRMCFTTKSLDNHEDGMEHD